MAEDLAELKKKMEQMPDDFIDTDQLAGMVNVVAPKDCQLKKSKLETCCCEEQCQLSFHHKFEEVDSFLRPVQLGAFEDFAWEAVDTYSWDSDGLWDTNINVDDVLGLKQA